MNNSSFFIDVKSRGVRTDNVIDHMTKVPRSRITADRASHRMPPRAH